jgi:hypothetical protein
MIKLFSDNELNESNYNTKLPLKCMQCNNIFYKTKKRIIQTFDIKNPASGGFCSYKCWSDYNHSNTTTTINCSECKKEKVIYKRDIREKNFCSSSCSAVYYNRPRKKAKIRKIKIPSAIIKIHCKYCNQETTNKKYCNGSCRNKDLNKHKNGLKSYAEKILVSKLKLNFPDWIIHENDRKILNGLELDVYIPNIKLAIEWNGIYHIEPIKGEEILQKIIKKDNTKIEMCKNLGINLIVISDRTSHKKFIEETTNDIVEKLQQYKLARMVGNAPTLTD